MSGINLVREKLKSFYGQFYGVVNIIFKFVLMFAVLYLMNDALGYNKFFSNIFIMLIMSLIASILSYSASPVIAAMALLGNAFSLGIDIGIITFMLVLVLLILFVWFVPEDSIATILAPLALAAGIPIFVPICFGLKRNPASVAAICPGVVAYYYIGVLSENADAIIAAGKTEYFTRIKLITEGMISNRELIVVALASAAVLIIVYAIRKFRGNYSWSIAVAVGMVLYLAIVLAGNSILEAGIPMLGTVIGVIVGGAASYIVQYFILNVDYKRAENLTFEDDEYYYYVKAIPKVIAGADRVPDYDEDDEDEDENLQSQEDDEFEYVDADEEEDDDYEYFDVDDEEYPEDADVVE